MEKLLDGLVMEGKLKRILSIWVGDRLRLKADDMKRLILGGSMKEKDFLEVQTYLLVGILQSLEDISEKLDAK